MKKTSLFFPVLFVMICVFSNCTTLNHSMREPNTKVNLSKNDFTLSDQVTAEATSTKILGIDFARIFTQKTGNTTGGSNVINISSIPVLGTIITTDKTSNYALYNLMEANPGYDVVFYPQYETKVVKPILGIGILTKITTVKTTARLGKLNK